MECLGALWLFTILLMLCLSFYSLTLGFMLKHRQREEAANLANRVMGSPQPQRIIKEAAQGDFHIEIRTWSSWEKDDSQAVEYLVYHKDRQLPLYNLVLYE